MVVWKAVWHFLKKLKTELPYDSAIPLLVTSWEHKSGYNKDTCTPMFTAALFTILKLWKKPRWPTIDEWIKNIYNIYINIYIYIHIYIQWNIIQP
jgi:hypothetical protein